MGPDIPVNAHTLRESWAHLMYSSIFGSIHSGFSPSETALAAILSDCSPTETNALHQGLPLGDTIKYLKGVQSTMKTFSSKHHLNKNSYRLMASYSFKNCKRVG